MGQKVHPKSIRLQIVTTWISNWFATGEDYGRFVKEDDLLRKYLHKKLKSAAVSRVEIDRKSKKLIVRIITGRPGIVVGRGGQGLDQLRKELGKIIGHQDIQLDVLEVDKIDAEAQLISESIAQQLEKRVSFRRAMKQAVQRAQRAGVKGIKIMASGRLGGAEIARSEEVKDGKVPLHTFRADIDYGFSEAKTVFGIIGVKVWVCRGEVLPGEKAVVNIKARSNRGGGAPQPGGGPQSGGRGKKRRQPRRPSAPVTTKHVADESSKAASESEPATEPNTPAAE